jgi:hypothetical protein
LPQAGVLSLLPAPSGDVIAPCATPSQLQPATALLNLPDDLLFSLPRFLRTANTILEIRNVARFRAACRALYLGIAAPIPDGLTGLIEFKQIPLELAQSGKDVVEQLNSYGDLVMLRNSV